MTEHRQRLNFNRTLARTRSFSNHVATLLTLARAGRVLLEKKIGCKSWRKQPFSASAATVIFLRVPFFVTVKSFCFGWLLLPK
jgi:hypothetical protein